MATEFDDLVAVCACWPRVELPDPSKRGFGSHALRVDGSIFAMESQGRLVVKLPAERVAALLESGVGEHFTAGKARWLKEWVSLPRDVADADDLVREAYEFVSRSAPSR